MKAWNKVLFVSATMLATLGAFASSAQAAGFNYIRIGDRDGLGYGNGSGYTAANGDAANVDGKGVLGVGDFIPDLNQDGKLATGKGDDFDNRSAAEKSNTAIQTKGFIDNGSTGSIFTDISLSTSFIKKSGRKANFSEKGFSEKDYKFQNTNGDQKTSKIPLPGFDFDFSVDKNNVVKDSPVYFNLLFGDYDVKDAKVGFWKADGSYFERKLTKQKNVKGQDGWIQSAFVELDFDEVFSATANGYDGLLRTKIIAPDEPYLTFDYAELSTRRISLDPDPQSVPEPTTILGLAIFGIFGASSLRKRQTVNS